MPRFEHPTLGTWTIRHQRGFGVAKRPSGKPDNRYATIVTIEYPLPSEDNEGGHEPAIGRCIGTTFWKRSEDEFNKQLALGMAFKRALDELQLRVGSAEFTALKKFLRASFRKIQSGKRIHSSRPVEIPPQAGPQVSTYMM